MKRALAMLLLLPSLARANALDTFGAGARSTGMAGAQAADTKGWAAAHHNPAGVALATDVEGAVNYGGAVLGLTLDGQDAKVTSPHGTTLGLAVPLVGKKVTLAFGVALYLPDQFVARIQLLPATQPHYILYDQNLQHVVVTPVGSLKLGSHFSIGAGATVLADAAGNGVTFDVGVVNGEKVGRAALDVSLPIRAAPVVGVMILPTRWLRFGAAWRGELDLGLKLDILANVNIAGVITGDTFITLRAVNFYSPNKIALGAAVEPWKKLTLSAEVDWLGWSGFTGALPDLRVLVELGISPSLVEALFPKSRFRDVWTPRLGAELHGDLHPRVGGALRLGYAYEPSPVPAQTGLTSFADGDRHMIALGGGLELRQLPILPKPVKLDFALQLHELVGQTTLKDPRVFPGQSFSSGGWMLYLGATLEARF